MIVCGDPGGEVAAVRAAHDAEAGTVELCVTLKSTLDEVDHVIGVDSAHGLPDRSAVLLPIARRTARVAEQHSVPSIDVHLEFVHQRDGILGERSAVDVHECRMRPLPLGCQSPAVHGVPGTPGDGELCRLTNAARTQRLREVGDRAECVAVDEREIPRGCGACETHDDPPGGRILPRHDDLGGTQPGDLTRGGDAHRAIATALAALHENGIAGNGDVARHLSQVERRSGETAGGCCACVDHVERRSPTDEIPSGLAEFVSQEIHGPGLVPQDGTDTECWPGRGERGHLAGIIDGDEVNVGAQIRVAGVVTCRDDCELARVG